MGTTHRVGWKAAQGDGAGDPGTRLGAKVPLEFQRAVGPAKWRRPSLQLCQLPALPRTAEQSGTPPPAGLGSQDSWGGVGARRDK